MEGSKSLGEEDPALIALLQTQRFTCSPCPRPYKVFVAIPRVSCQH